MWVNASLLSPGQGHLFKGSGPPIPIISLTGIFSATGKAVGGASLGILHHLSQETAESLTKTGETLVTLQEQLVALAGVALQNQRALYLLTALVGVTCLYLKEEYCFYVNESGQVQQNIQSILESTSRINISTFLGFKFTVYIFTSSLCSTVTNYTTNITIWTHDNQLTKFIPSRIETIRLQMIFTNNY